MFDTDLTRSTVALYLATIDLFTAPLRVLTHPPVASAEEQAALQQEVWALWGEQPPPLTEVLFP
ncbi:MAG TPA: hypothetical protein VK997_14290 [Deferrisomatales bacterium]|nr:hypothetical protein [Deferrisomatales bacterium]